tara:strand:- start:2477 stop:3163 length:687 start_codon:yes stop_codon:yes gene_type:complete
MSRLRRGGKYTGGSFAKSFSQAKMNGTPMFSMYTSPLNVAVAGEDPDSAEDISKPDAEDGASSASQNTGSIKDVVPKKVGSEGRRSSLNDYFAKTKMMAEDKAEEAKEEAEKQAEEEAAAKAEEEREALSQGSNISGSSDGGKGSGKARRQAKRDAKNAAKDEKKALMAECSGLQGKAKRQCKKGARKNFRGDKKAIRKENRAKRRSNTKKKIKKLLCTKRRRRKGKC